MDPVIEALLVSAIGGNQNARPRSPKPQLGAPVRQIQNLTGWRVSYLHDGIMRAPHLGQILTPDQPAICRHTPTHQTPTPNCTCGYYAVRPGHKAFAHLAKFIPERPQLNKLAQIAMGPWFSENLRNQATRVFHQIQLFNVLPVDNPEHPATHRITCFRGRTFKYGTQAFTNDKNAVNQLNEWFPTVRVTTDLSALAQRTLS